MGHPARWVMLMALRDGCALPMSMLASEAGVAPSTASEHLAKLTDGGLLRAVRRGRRCYFVLASTDVAHAIDALARLSPAVPAVAQAPREVVFPPRSPHLARTCYDHLGGNLAVSMTNSLLHGGVLAGGNDRVTARGGRLLEDFGVKVEPSRRQLVTYCVDWTEQRHLGGTLGAALMRRFTELGWLRPYPRIARVLQVTDVGRRGFKVAFGVTIDHPARTTGVAAPAGSGVRKESPCPS